MKSTKAAKARKGAGRRASALPIGTSYGPHRKISVTRQRNGRSASRHLASVPDARSEFSIEAANQLVRIRGTLGLTQNELAGIFGVRRQAVDQWSDRNVPMKRVGDIDRLYEITLELAKRIKRQRLPQVVRGPLPILADRSILETLAGDGVDPIYELIRRWDSYVPGGDPIRPGDFASD
jgi:hypothetical protein